MYSEDYEEKSQKKEFPFRDFLLKLILIIIFVLLLVWLIPWPNNRVLTDRIFNANIQEMKDASLLYFTKDRLPAKVGDKKTVTLREMLDLKLLLPFTDKNGKSCDVDKSYVTIEKLEDEYLLKVYLKCGDEEDYILVHVGCYAYCTTEVCEKKEDKVATSTPTQTNKPQPTSNPQPTNTPKPGTPTPTPSGTPTPSDSEPYCSLTVTDGTLASDGSYVSNVTIGWASKGSTNGASITNYGLGSSLNYQGANSFVVSQNGTTTVYGFVKDSKGKTASCSITVNKKNQDVTPTTEYEYQYSKDINKQYSEWGAWSKDTVYVDADNIPFGNYEFYQIENLGARREVIGYKNYTLTYKKTKPVYVGSYDRYTCTGYKYEVVDNVVYSVSSDWQRTNEVYTGDVAPRDSATEQWRFESVDQSTCLPTCTDHSLAKWRKYTRSATPAQSSVSSSNGTLTCAQVSVEKVPVYATETNYETVTAKVDVYADVKYYRFRSRTLVKDAYTDIKWASTPNDQTLTSQGYTYTGVKRVK